LVLGVIIANLFLGYSALTGEAANSTLGFADLLPLKVKQNFHVLELLDLLESRAEYSRKCFGIIAPRVKFEVFAH
jgi:hypothetical protein